MRPAIYFPGGRGPGKAEEGKRPAVAAPTRWLSMARPDSSGGGGPWTDRWGPKSRPSILRGSAAVSLPTRPAGLLQLDLKVRPRCSPSVLGWRALRGVHGGGQRGLRSTTGQRPGAHERPAVSPLRAAERRCARRRTRRLARRGSGLQAPTATPATAAVPGAARRPYCPPSLGRRSPPPPAAASHFLPAFPFFGRKPLPGPGARRANSSALPRPCSRSPRKSQLSSRRAPRFLIKSR